jgi:hypothetical protein
MAGVTPINDVPDAPTIGAATNVGTSRAYNNGSATVAYTAAATGGPVTTFTATSTPGSFTGTGTSPITVTGLQSATSYTFTVSAANANGTQTSSASSSITATTVPAAPTIGTFTDGGTGTTGTLSFTAGATGGSTITNYSFSTDGSTYTALSPAQTTSPLSLTGLTAGTYNFSVKAVNANGDSTASGTVSGTVITPSSFESIATATGTGSSGTITFTSIPGTYKNLQIRYNGRCDRAGVGLNDLFMTFNSDTGSNYTSQELNGNGSSVSASVDGPSTRILIPNSTPGAQAAANIMGVGIINFQDYSSTSKYKTVGAITGAERNGESSRIYSNSGVWASNSAITSISFTAPSSNFTTSTIFSLYGIKG